MSSGLSRVGRPIADRVIRYFARKRPDASAAEAAAFARVSLFCAINGLANFIYGVGFFGLDRWLPGYIVIGVALLSWTGVFAAGASRSRKSLRRIVHSVLFSTTIGLAAVACVSGHLGELSPWFLSLCAAAAVLLLGDATALLWTAIVMSTIMAIPELRQDAPTEAYVIAPWELPVSQAGLTLILVFYAIVTRRATEAHVDTLASHDAELKRYVRRLEESMASQEEAHAALENERDGADAARRAAEEANLAKSHFLANMTHELRTPLNAVIGYAELISEENDGDQAVVVDARKIQQAGRTLLKLVDDLLDVSKIEAGRAEVDLEVIEVGPIGHQALGAVRPIADRNGNRLVIELDDDVGTIVSDPLKVSQILVNLLANACKFTEEGDVALRIHRDGDSMVFTVHDTGIGMSSEQIERVFQPFRQADSSTTRKYGGTGLGLAIAKSYARLLGGKISVSSEPEVGTTFVVRLPLVSTERPISASSSGPSTI